MDPVTMSMIGKAAGKVAPAILQTAGGLFQTLFSGRKKAQRELDKLVDSSPAYTPNKGISDYYQESLNRYNESPYQSAIYQNAMRNAQRVTSQGIGALQDRRSALAGVGRLAAIQNDATQNAVAQAEGRRDARFSQLGQSTQMKAGEERRAFDINVLSPYQRRLQMAQMKSSAANARHDAGLQNMFQGVSNMHTLLSDSGGSGGGGGGQQGFSTGSSMQNAVLQQKKGALSSFGSQKQITNFKPPTQMYSSQGNFFNNPIPYAD